jgi:hypothetical protein
LTRFFTQEAAAILVDLTDSDDEDVIEAAYEAMAEEPWDDEYDDEDDKFLH